MTQPIAVDFLRAIVMRAPHVLVTRDFYVDNWGLTVSHETDDAVYFRGTGSEPFIYGLREGKTYGVDQICFGMNSAARIDDLHAQLVAKGAPTTARGPVTTPGGGYGFSTLDPDGRRLSFTADVARYTDEEDRLALPRKITHVVLNSESFEKNQAFYEEMLGFRVSDYSANAMVFLRCSSDHHAIALNRASYPSVNHVAFEMASIDSFMRGIGRMKTRGQAPAWGPGRHGPGNNPFAYFVSPSGFVIEFTSEVLQIDEATHEPQVWPRNIPEKMDLWMTAGPPTPAMRTVMAGRPDPGFQSL
ncbi:VOC family protein [Acidiphilium sp. AL]|uniref:VOC family protein n=1 Tax=Acidiphilium iwatense TaxID=768198 RepID=A0ABS9E1H2_9PROT|nr:MULTISPECIES: VOC family protein [Acidiphilium]MCF3948198.1 VOC family protein [Acidiphilium iwatense]MCU4161685.1 VOC family protein [Acidiphilium sp. AL]